MSTRRASKEEGELPPLLLPSATAPWPSHPPTTGSVPAHDGLLSVSAFDLNGIPRGRRTILVAAFDVAGNRSAGVASLVVDLGEKVKDLHNSP